MQLRGGGPVSRRPVRPDAGSVTAQQEWPVSALLDRPSASRPQQPGMRRRLTSQNGRAPPKVGGARCRATATPVHRPAPGSTNHRRLVPETRGAFILLCGICPNQPTVMPDLAKNITNEGPELHFERVLLDRPELRPYIEIGRTSECWVLDSVGGPLRMEMVYSVGRRVSTLARHGAIHGSAGRTGSGLPGYHGVLSAWHPVGKRNRQDQCCSNLSPG